MARTLVVDTAGLIALARLDRLVQARDHIGRLVVTPAVVDEALDGDRPGARAVAVALEAGVLERVAPAQASLSPGIGAGEAESIALGLARGDPVLLDDLEARRAAKRLGVSVIGTVALLVDLHKAGLVHQMKAGSPPDDEELDRLESFGFRMTAEVRRWALDRAAE